MKLKLKTAGKHAVVLESNHCDETGTMSTHNKCFCGPPQNPRAISFSFTPHKQHAPGKPEMHVQEYAIIKLFF